MKKLRLKHKVKIEEKVLGKKENNIQPITEKIIRASRI